MSCRPAKSKPRLVPAGNECYFRKRCSARASARPFIAFCARLTSRFAAANRRKYQSVTKHTTSRINTAYMTGSPPLSMSAMKKYIPPAKTIGIERKPLNIDQIGHSPVAFRNLRQPRYSSRVPARTVEFVNQNNSVPIAIPRATRPICSILRVENKNRSRSLQLPRYRHAIPHRQNHRLELSRLI
jgi:hypothetical protein